MARPQASPTSPGSRALIVDLIRSSGPISRTELVSATGLTQPAISLIVRRLLDDEIIVETGKAPSTGGKPRLLLDINRQARQGIGVHLGIESITLIATDTHGGVLARQRLNGAGNADPMSVVSRLIHAIQSFAETTGIPIESANGVAIAVPGSANPLSGELLATPSLPKWQRFPLRELLERELGVPVLVDNDASAAALGEFWSRGVSRHTTFGCVYIGAGIGAGVVVDGALYRGASSNATELGHMTIDINGPTCVCGNVGCLELYAAPKVVVSRALRDQGLRRHLDLDENTLVAHSYDALARAALEGDAACERYISEGARLVGAATVSMCNLFDLDEIVLTGPGLAIAGAMYAREVRSAVSRVLARHAHEVRVDLSINPIDSAAIGAAALTMQGALAPGHGPPLEFGNDPGRKPGRC